MNPQNIAVRDAAGQQQLLLEAHDHTGIFGQFRLQDLQRHRTPQFLINGFIHPAHAAFPEQLLDSEARSKIHPRLQSAGNV